MSVIAAFEALQRIDLELMRLRRQLDELPEKKAILETRAKHKEVATLSQKARLLVHKLETELKAHQDETALMADKIAAEQTKLMGTTDHRAAQSITREMDAFRRKADKLEMESLEMMERIESARGKGAQVDEAVARLVEREQALIARYKSVGGAIQERIAELDGERARVTGSLDEGLLKRYEESVENRGGIGIGHLEGDTCSACRVTLPAEKLNALRHGDPIGTCPNCRRLIITVSDDA